MTGTQEYEKLGYLNEDVRFFYLKDTKMRSFPSHYHDFDKLLIFLSGTGRYHVEGKTYSLTPFDMVCIPHGNIHCPEVDFSKPYERYILYLSPAFYSAFGGSDASVLSCLFDHSRETGDYVYHTELQARYPLEQLLSELTAQSTGSGEDRRPAGDLYVRTLVIQLLIRLARLKEEHQLTSDRTAVYDARILELLRYIQDNYRQELTVGHLSERFYLSRYHLMRQFKEATGCTLHSYINNKRLSAARDAIQSGIPATTAALQCGFHDYSTFSRAYKKAFGCSPATVPRTSLLH